MKTHIRNAQKKIKLERLRDETRNHVIDRQNKYGLKTEQPANDRTGSGHRDTNKMDTKAHALNEP